MSVVDVPGVDVSSPAVLRVKLVVQIDPASASKKCEEPPGNK